MRSLFEKEEKEMEINQLKVDLISRFYPFSKEEVIKYQSILNFGYSHLMSNASITWNTEMIDQLIDKVEWSAIHKIQGINFDLSFFSRYESYIDFNTIHFSKNIIWSEDLIKAYGDKFDWSKSFITKEPLNTIENLRRFKDQFDWELVSERINIDFDEDVLKEFADKWDWKKLSSNINLPLTVEFIQKHKDKLDFNVLSRNPVSLDLIYKYPASKKWDWHNVIINPGITYDRAIFNFVFSQFTTYLENNGYKHPAIKKMPLGYFLFVLFSRQRNDISFFLKEEFLKYMPWENFCKYCNTKLSLDFIEKNKGKINFKEREFIRCQKEVISNEFIFENLELFNPDHYSFYCLPLSIEILNKLESKINWRWLSSCEKLDWNWNFIDKYHYELNFYRLSENKGIYEQLIKGKLPDKEILGFLEEELKKKGR